MGEDNEEIETFKDLGLSEPLVEACEKLGWKNLLKIQAEAILKTFVMTILEKMSLDSHKQILVKLELFLFPYCMPFWKHQGQKISLLVCCLPQESLLFKFLSSLKL